MAKKLEGQKKLLKEQKGNSAFAAVLSMRSIYLLLLKKNILVFLELHSGPLLPAVRRNILGSKTSLLPSVVSLFFSVPFPVLCQRGGRQCSWRCDGRGSHVVHRHERHRCGPAAASLLHFPSSCSHADFILRPARTQGSTFGHYALPLHTSVQNCCNDTGHLDLRQFATFLLTSTSTLGTDRAYGWC